MTKRRSGAILTRLHLSRESAVPVWRQLEDQLRQVILSRQLPGGARLPSSRVLAGDLGVSRPTVVQVLERLEAEGLVEMRHGAGTFVAEALPLEVAPPRGRPRGAAMRVRRAPPSSARGS